jgi:hypothetical protein
MAYKIGEKTWFKGDEITITTDAYELYGTNWQDGVDETGKIVTVKTKESKDADVAAKKKEWTDQQAAFRRLRENS